MKITVEVTVGSPPPGYTEDELMRDVEFALVDGGLHTEENQPYNVDQVVRKLP